MNQLSHLSNDVNVITAEINSYKQMAGQAIFEIGKRLKHVKESELQHGQFSKWCKEELNFSQSQAIRYMRAYEKFSNSSLGANLSLKKMDLLSSFDDEELEKEVETPSGESKKLTEMTQREIEEYKRKLKEAEKAKHEAEQEAEQSRKSEEIAMKRLEEAENREPKVVEKIIEDETKVNKLSSELEGVRKEKEKIERLMAEEKRDAESYRLLQKELSELKGKRDDLEREIESARSIAKFISNIEHSLENDLAPMKYSKALVQHRDDPVIMENVNNVLLQVESWCKEIRSSLPSEEYINAEVIDYE